MRRRLPSLLATGLTAAVLSAVPTTTTVVPTAAAAGDGVRTMNGCVKSRPSPNTDRRVDICYTIFKPAGASRDRKVPFIVHSHGWGGSRTTNADAFSQWLDAGYGVLSFDQRGFGESGSKARVERPTLEGRDNLRLIRLVASLPWVRKDGPNDPRMGAIGGSYGGGFQYLGAFMALKKWGTPVYDALAPEITWHDLNESLAPQGVVRFEWAGALAAASVESNALPRRVKRALAEGAATGNWPDGSVPGGVDIVDFFRKNGPRWHVAQGRRLDIPVLMGQGTTDTLFNLQQGLDNWHRAITRDARQESIFVGYNGGHVVPQFIPPGVQVDSDPCSQRLAGGDFGTLALRFMDEQLKGRDRGLRGYGRLHLATPGSTCTTVRSVRPDTVRRIDGPVATTEAGGAPTYYPVAEGPIRIAGSAYFTGELTAPGVPTSRAFYGLAVGPNPVDAKLVQNNVYPVNQVGPVSGAPRRVELPAVAVNVPAGETLYLAASPVDQTFAATDRTPGAVIFQDTRVHLPVVRR